MKTTMRETLPGLLLALIFAGAAFGLAKLAPVVGGPVFAITLGIAAASLRRPGPRFSRGLKFSSKVVLQLAVILLGFEMNLANVVRVGRQSLLVIGLTLTAAFLTAFVLGRALGVRGKLTTLIGVGTAICGGSAIAAASTAIRAEDEDVSYSIATIFLFNVAAVFLFPFVGHLLQLSDTGFGMWAGTAINDTSSVVAAGYSYSAAAGDFATVVKLTRSLMIVPVTLALALLFARDGEQGGFNFAKVFPWFVAGFLAASLLRSTGLLPGEVTRALAQGGKFLILAAMAAIGLNTNAAAFVKAGPRALLLGGGTWLAVMLSSLLVQLGTQLW